MSDLEQKTFERIGQATKAGAKAGNPLFGKLAQRLARDDAPDGEALDWAADADWAQLQQEPLRARRLLRLSVVLVLVLLLWASVAKVDQVTRGEGRVVPSQQVQIVQSVDGGVVSEILVREGQVVEADQVLLRVDPTRFAANLGETRVSQAALEARAERLRALIQGRSFNPSVVLEREAPAIVAQERSLFESRRAEISAQIAITQSQLLQRRQELH